MQLSRQKDNEEVLLSRCVEAGAAAASLGPTHCSALLVMFYGIILSYFAFPSSSGRAPLPPFPRSLARSFPERAREAEGDRGRGVGACSAAAAARSQVLFLSLHSSRATTTFLRRFLNLLLSCSRARDRDREGERGLCRNLFAAPLLQSSLPLSPRSPSSPLSPTTAY